MTKLPTVTTLKSIKTTLVCLGALLFGACSDITTEGGAPDTPVDSSDLVYFAFSIHDVSSQEAGATRADRFDSDNNDYEYGTQGYIFNKGLKEEKAIYKKDNYLEEGEDEFAHFITDSPHRAFIFDNEGNKIGDLFLRGIIHPKSQDGTPNAIPDETPKEWDSYTILYTTVPEDKMLTMQAAADKILVVLNAGDATLNKLQDLDKYTDIKGVVNDRENALYFEKDGTKYFTMSSSIVIKAGDILPYNTVKELKYYDELEDAIDNASNLEMYVERLHAKYTLLFKPDPNKDEYKYFDSSETNAAAEAQYSAVKNLILESTDFKPTETTLRYVSSYTRGTSVNKPGDLKSKITSKNWKVNFTGWGLNALEKEEYLFKNISSGSKYFDNWHDLAYRNFWAEDKTYNSGTYPDQYRTADDDLEVEVEAGEDTNTSNQLKAGLSLEYYPYNRLNQQFIHQYSPESTFPTSIFSKYSTVKDAYNDQAHLRAGTHIIITAQLLIDGFDDDAVYNSTATDAETGLVSDVKDKYYMNDIYWAENAYKEYVAEYLAFWMLTDENQAEEKFGKNDGNFYVLKSGTTDVYELAKAENFQIVSAKIKGGDGMVWVKPVEGTTLYLYNENAESESDKYKEITENQFKTLAFDHTEYFAKHYKGGRMYYPVPVRHNINGNSLTYKTGDFGSVRNHWYYFTVEKILTPGAPVDVPDQPIIPNNEPTTNGLGVNIKVLDWNRIGTTVEDITDQNHSKD